MIVVKMNTERILHYDSHCTAANISKKRQTKPHYKKFDGVLNYLEDQYVIENPGQNFHKEEWSIIESGIDVPQQHNGHDCGLFYFICRGFDLKFTQIHICKARDKIVQDILAFRDHYILLLYILISGCD